MFQLRVKRKRKARARRSFADAEGFYVRISKNRFFEIPIGLAERQLATPLRNYLNAIVASEGTVLEERLVPWNALDHGFIDVFDGDGAAHAVNVDRDVREVFERFAVPYGHDDRYLALDIAGR